MFIFSGNTSTKTRWCTCNNINEFIPACNDYFNISSTTKGTSKRNSSGLGGKCRTITSANCFNTTSRNSTTNYSTTHTIKTISSNSINTHTGWSNHTKTTTSYICGNTNTKSSLIFRSGCGQHYSPTLASINSNQSTSSFQGIPFTIISGVHATCAIAYTANTTG